MTPFEASTSVAVTFAPPVIALPPLMATPPEVVMKIGRPAMVLCAPAVTADAGTSARRPW